MCYLCSIPYGVVYVLCAMCFLSMFDPSEVVVGRLGGNRYQGATLFKG